jgi:hypothetical protein
MLPLRILLLIGILLCSCSKSSDDRNLERFEFVQDYTATVTVGGFVGVESRTFYVGEIYTGTDSGGETISIRIAEHTKRNEDCPNPWCYQEFLEVPRLYLLKL